MFSASIVALVTPMQQDGAVDYPALLALLDWHIENKTDGIVLLGTTGEAATITNEEREQIISRSIAHVKERVPIIVGTGSNSTTHTIEQTLQAQRLGANAALLVTPYYNKPTQEGLYLHYKTVAKAVSLPLILYNVPSRTGCDLLPETVIRLATIPTIVGLKEALGEVDRVTKILKSGAEIEIYSGDDGTALDLMRAGAKGVISVAANVVPHDFHQMCRACLTGDDAVASEIDKRLQPLYKALFVESNPIPTKWILQKMGKIAQGIRLPLTPLATQFHAQVLAAMKQVEI